MRTSKYYQQAYQKAVTQKAFETPLQLLLSLINEDKGAREFLESPRPEFDQDRNQRQNSESENKRSILIIDDNAESTSVISLHLEHSYKIERSKKADEAIQLSVLTEPDLILISQLNSNKEVLQTITSLKTNRQTHLIPIILLTDKGEHQAKIDVLRAGVDDYFVKPISIEELSVRIENLILHRKKLATLHQTQKTNFTSRSREMSIDEKFLHRVNQVIEANMSSSSFSVEKLAKEVGLCRTQLLRKLKALTGSSPSELIRDFRLNKAAYMISKKMDTVTQIGYAVGFNDQSYFTKCFKKRFGMTPTKYLESQYKLTIRNYPEGPLID